MRRTCSPAWTAAASRGSSLPSAAQGARQPRTLPARGAATAPTPRWPWRASAHVVRPAGAALRRAAPSRCRPLRVAEQLASQAVTALVGQTSGASRSAVAALAAAIDARDNYTHAHSEQVVKLASEVAARLGLARCRGRAGPRRRDAARRRQGGDPERDPVQGRVRSTARVGDHARAPVRSASASSCARPSWRRSRRWCATSTSAGTASATPTACAARRSPSAAASSWPATPTTR